MSASFHFLQSTLANVPISQVQSVSDYAHPSPVMSIHRRDDDSDESEDGEGLAREEEADNARRDLGLGGDEEEEADEEEADEEEADEEEAAEGANADCLARMGAGAAGAGAGAARAAGVAREMAVAARAPRGSGPNRSPCQHQAMDGQGGVRINGTAWACNKCKVNLCEACFGDFDHARGCLMGQKAAV
jgi:hypothetical protein